MINTTSLKTSSNSILLILAYFLSSLVFAIEINLRTIKHPSERSLRMKEPYEELSEKNKIENPNSEIYVFSHEGLHQLCEIYQVNQNYRIAAAWYDPKLPNVQNRTLPLTKDEALIFISFIRMITNLNPSEEVGGTVGDADIVEYSSGEIRCRTVAPITSFLRNTESATKLFISHVLTENQNLREQNKYDAFKEIELLMIESQFFKRKEPIH